MLDLYEVVHQTVEEAGIVERLCEKAGFSYGPMRDSFRPISLCANRRIASPVGRSEAELIYRNTVGGTVRGLGISRFRLSFAQTREQGSRTYVWRDQVFQRRIEVLKGTLTDYHEAMAYMTFLFLAVEFGKDEARWSLSVKLSNHAPSFTMLLKIQDRCLLGEHHRRVAPVPIALIRRL